MVACSVDEQSVEVVSESKQIEPETSSDGKWSTETILSNINAYEVSKLSYEEEGMSFKVLTSDTAMIGLFETSIPTEIKRITDSIKKYQHSGGTVSYEECCEATDIMISIDPKLPNTIEEYVDGFEWIKIDKDYYKKSQQYGLWGYYVEEFFNYAIDFSHSEIALLKRFPVDSIGLSLDSYHHPDFDYSTGISDTLFFYDNYPNKKIPIRSTWNSIRWYGGPSFIGSNVFDRFGFKFLNTLRNVDIQQLDIDSTYQFVLKEFSISEDFTEQVVNHFGKEVLFNLNELKQIDQMLGTSYYQSWYNWKNPPNVTLSEAESFMLDRCQRIRQNLVRKKTVDFQGTTLYMFMSIAENGMVCISTISEHKLEVIASDCGQYQRKVDEWNNL